jgi:hypothetical protein
MRISFAWVMAAATTVLAIGSASAQETPVKSAGPDRDQANNERYWGIVNNSNNSYQIGRLRDISTEKSPARTGRTTGIPSSPTASAKPEAASSSPSDDRTSADRSLAGTTAPAARP